MSQRGRYFTFYFFLGAIFFSLFHQRGVKKETRKMKKYKNGEKNEGIIKMYSRLWIRNLNMSTGDSNAPNRSQRFFFPQYKCLTLIYLAKDRCPSLTILSRLKCLNIRNMLDSFSLFTLNFPRNFPWEFSGSSTRGRKLSPRRT